MTPIRQQTSAELLILTAVRPEFDLAAGFVSGRTKTEAGRRLRTGLFRGRQAALVQMGIGAERAAEATQRAIDAFQPRQALLLGFSGGLSPTLTAGDLVCPDRVVSEKGEELSSQSIDLENGIVGPILSCHHVISSPEEKRRLFERFGALCVDMESFAVLQACQQGGIPLAIVRAVSDAADQALAEEIAHLVSESGDLRLMQLARLLIRHPWTISSLLKLGSDVRRASDALRNLLSGGRFLTEE